MRLCAARPLDRATDPNLHFRQQTTAAHPASSVTHLPSEPICPRYGPPAMHSPPSSRATTPAHDYATSPLHAHAHSTRTLARVRVARRS
eukprot:scaffold130220_cov49-Phaeocystis_antarctica.AAC.1